MVQPTAAMAAQHLVEHIISIAQQATAQASSCSIALSGGTTPREAYRLLATQPLSEQVPWDKMEVFFGDERDVSPDNVENNYRMASNLLLDHVPVPLSHVHPMPTDASDMNAAARQYEELIRRLVPARDGDLPSFDVILLGMGGEGHTASLFPETPAVCNHEQLVVSHFVPVIGRNRMTFTFPLINAARNVIFFVTGADKAKAVAAVLSDMEARYAMPAAHVAPRHGQLFFYLDAEAARLLH